MTLGDVRYLPSYLRERLRTASLADVREVLPTAAGYGIVMVIVVTGSVPGWFMSIVVGVIFPAGVVGLGVVALAPSALRQLRDERADQRWRARWNPDHIGSVSGIALSDWMDAQSTERGMVTMLRRLRLSQAELDESAAEVLVRFLDDDSWMRHPHLHRRPTAAALDEAGRLLELVHQQDNRADDDTPPAA
jgi:hypothetical protein